MDAFRCDIHRNGLCGKKKRKGVHRYTQKKKGEDTHTWSKEIGGKGGLSPYYNICSLGGGGNLEGQKERNPVKCFFR